MIAKFTILAPKGLPLPIHGDEMAMHSYLHDVASAFEIILFNGVVGEFYNIGTQQERSVVSVATGTVAFFKHDAISSIVHVNDRAFNNRRYFTCDEKLIELGWQESMDWGQRARKKRSNGTK
jgi:UDP-glucose 4,6-dehydratase